jgi:hypothetical protein
VAAAAAGIAASTAVTIQVLANSSYAGITLEPQRVVTRQAIESTAGTFGDPSRYFQLLPGVVSDNDQRNDVLVRGGNPAENLFLVDGIPVPSINHLALSDTTGGLVSMIDNDAIQSITLHSGVHDARFDDRLSAVMEITTVPDRQPAFRRTVEAGLEGVGGVASRPIGDSGSLLLSGRQSILNLFTNDIGLDGVPIYTNMLARANDNVTPQDRLWGMSLTGIDSIAIRPSATDTAETNPFNINYSGWRNTTGLNWQHTLSGKTFVLTTVSNSQQSQNISEMDQLLGNGTTYVEHSSDGNSTARSEITSTVASRLFLDAGGSVTSQRVNYNIAQPDPLPSPYSASPVSNSVTAIQQVFSTPSEAGFLQATALLPWDARLTLGGRVQHWSFGDHTSYTPRALFSIPVNRHVVTLGYAEYTQVPSFLYLLAYPQNHALAPIRAEHLTADADVLHTSTTKLILSAYRKLYFDYPVATPYPQLSLANIADTFGTSFLLFPMQSGGRGRTEGVELSTEVRPSSRLLFNATATYARAWYSGLDGILRRGNYDIPFVGNVTGLFRVGKSSSISARYSGASGRPYTPDNLAESLAQNRDVYDLRRVNEDRSATYGRLDIRFEQSRQTHYGVLSWNAGLLNVLNQKNFYAYIWEPRSGAAVPSEQDQMPRFPEGAVKLTF